MPAWTDFTFTKGRYSVGENTVEVYINLLRNKIDKPFPVKLIHTKPKNNKAIVTVRFWEKFQEIEFKNTGDPLSPDERQKIFAPFYRATNVTLNQDYIYTCPRRPVGMRWEHTHIIANLS